MLKGKNPKIKLLILVTIFLLTILAVLGSRNTARTAKQVHLKDYLLQLPGYTTSKIIDLDQDTYNFLKLDDYIYADFLGKDGMVNLFIGFYNTIDKLSAAHSPLVCFPGQGWQVSLPTDNHLTVDGHDVWYSEITASIDDQKKLVIYWYQAFQETSPEVYRNKIRAVYNKLLSGEEQHAFVRVTLTMQDAFLQNQEYQSKQAATAFIKTFYPQLIRFLINGTKEKSPSINDAFLQEQNQIAAGPTKQ